MARKPTILVIETERLYIELLATAIESEAWNIVGTNKPRKAIQLVQRRLPEFVILDLASGYAAFCVTTGREAIEAVDRDPSIAVAVIDLLMPDIGGLATINEILKRQPHPTVIIATASVDHEIARQALKLGAFDCVTKPIDLSAMSMTVSAAIGHFEYERQNVRSD